LGYVEHKFHGHFYSGSLHLRLTNLTSVRQGRDEIVSTYIKRLKEIKNNCFNLSITDMDLANIYLKVLRSSTRDKIEGSDFLSVAQVKVAALVVENQMNKEKDNFKSRSSNVHLIDYDSDSSSDTVTQKFMLLNLFAPLRKNLIIIHHLSRLVKVSKKKLNLLLMFPNVIISLMNYLNPETLNSLTLYLHLMT
jgi:hypothetical protein